MQENRDTLTVRDRKWVRMNKIRTALETGDRSKKEVIAIVLGTDPSRSDKRALDNDLWGLIALGLITMEGKDQYHSTETTIKFKNLSEYKIILNHSRRLVLSSKSHQGFDQMTPDTLINFLVPEIETTDAENLAWQIKYDVTMIEDRRKYFLSHLKTDYYAEIYEPLLRYREIGENYPKIRLTLNKRKWMLGDWDEGDVIDIHPDDDIFQGPFGVPDNLLYDTRPIEGHARARQPTKVYVLPIVRKPEDRTPVFREVVDNPTIVREFISLKYDIVGRVYSLVGMVKNGTPLSGRCDACPKIKIDE